VAISLYHLLRFLKEEDPALAGGSIFFWNGLIAGCILWIKFSLLGFWAGWLLAFVINLVLEKRIHQAVKGIGAIPAWDAGRHTSLGNLLWSQSRDS